MTHVEAARAWAKVLAYIACGKPQLARPWAEQLIAWWTKAGVLDAPAKDTWDFAAEYQRLNKR